MMAGDKEGVDTVKDKEVEKENNTKASDQQEKNEEVKSGTTRSSSDNENSENEAENEFDPDSNRKKKRKIVPYTQQQVKRQLKLLKYSEHYMYFLRPQDHPELQVELDKLNFKNKKNVAKGAGRHRDPNRKEIMSNFDDELEGKVMHFETTPPFVDPQYSMRDYQIDGLNWLIRMYADGMNGILADEMGLGKTFQVISLLSYLHMYENIKGPHLIICPKSVCRNWAEEFDKWVPGMFRVKILEGEKEVRRGLIKQLQDNPNSYDVIISSPELAVIEHSFLKKRRYVYTILDEAHRIKNANSKFTLKLKELNFDHSLLITGTPLQNNLDELWSLLNFISRDVFSDHEDFKYWLTNQSDENTAIEKLKMIISPFILRRIKIEVEKSLLPKKVRQIYTGLSAVQKKLYKDLLSSDIQLINDHKKAKNQSGSLANLLVQLRKCVNHPYIFRHIEPQPYVEGEHLVEVCGKLSVLDKLLKHWKENGDRVLVFSQMLGFLDIFEDYCIMRGYKYCRIDGSTEHELRVSQIKEYNKPGSEKFLFLLSTKAAGQGINLATANIVVIYDLDWNPQVDLQAMDRAHRIGQKRQVHVYQLITEDSIEEKVLEKATKKLKLDQMVIQKKLVNTATSKVNASEILTTVRHGAKEILEGEGKSTIRNETIEEILAKSEARSQKFEQEMASVGYSDLITLSDQSIKLNEERMRHNVSIKNTDHIFLAPDSRQRARREVNYSELPKPKVAPTDYSKYDYRFYPQELHALYEKENDYYLKCYPELIPANILPGSPERTRIMQARSLTIEEEVQKQQLINKGFNNWSRKDYQLILKTLKDPFFYEFDYLFDKFKDSNGNLTKSTKDILDYFSHLMKNCDKLTDFNNVRVIFKDWIDRVNTLNQNLVILKKLDKEFKKSNFQNPFNSIQNSIKSTKFSPDQQLSLCLLSYDIGLKNPDLYLKLQNALIDHHDFIGCWGICSLNAESLKKSLNSFLSALNEHKFIEKAAQEKSQNTNLSKLTAASNTNINDQPQKTNPTSKVVINSAQSAVTLSPNAAKSSTYVHQRPESNAQNSLSTHPRPQPNPVTLPSRTSSTPVLANTLNHNPQPVQIPVQSINSGQNYPKIDHHIVNSSRHNSIAESSGSHNQSVQDPIPRDQSKSLYLQSINRGYAGSNHSGLDMNNPVYAQQQVSQQQYSTLSHNTQYSPTQVQEHNHHAGSPMHPYSQSIAHKFVAYYSPVNQISPQFSSIPSQHIRHHPQAAYPMANAHVLQEVPQRPQVMYNQAAPIMIAQNPDSATQYTNAAIGLPRQQLHHQVVSPNPQATYQRPIAPSVTSNAINIPVYGTQAVYSQSTVLNQHADVPNQHVTQQNSHVSARYSTSPQSIGSHNTSLINQNNVLAPINDRYMKERSDSPYYNGEYQTRKNQSSSINITSENPMLIQTSHLSQSINAQSSTITVPQGYSINLKSTAHTDPQVIGNTQSDCNTPTQSDFIQSLSSPGHHSVTPRSIADQSPNPNSSNTRNPSRSGTPHNLPSNS